MYVRPYVTKRDIIFLFLIQTLSSCNLPQSTLVTQLLSRYPKPASQLVPLPSQLVPQNEQDHIADLTSSIWGRVMCKLDIEPFL